jgi:hypothetical protein
MTATLTEKEIANATKILAAHHFDYCGSDQRLRRQ